MEFHQSSAFNPGSCLPRGFPSSSAVPLWLNSKELACSAGDTGDMGSIPGLEDPLEENMATHSNILAWRIPWTEESGGLQSIVLQRVGHD